MPDQFTSSIVGILNSENEVIGAGFLISQTHVITCSHVVTQALNISNKTTKAPIRQVSLNFPWTIKEEGISPRVLTGRVTLWQPVTVPPLPGSDIAVLVLNSDLPEGSQVCPLVAKGNLEGHSFEAYGFPCGVDTCEPAKGIIRRKLPNGRAVLEDINDIGFWISPGFSGTPVWDNQTNSIVGMIDRAEAYSDIRTAYMIPATQLVKTCGKLIPGKHKTPSTGKALIFGIVFAIFLTLVILITGLYNKVYSPGEDNKKVEITIKENISGKWIYRNPPDNYTGEEKWTITQDGNKLRIKAIKEHGREAAFYGRYFHGAGEFSFSFDIPMTVGPPEVLHGHGKIDNTGNKITGMWERQGGLSGKFFLVRIQE